MMRTEHKVTPGSPYPIACKSNAGTYSLPKSLIRLMIDKEEAIEATGQNKRYELKAVQVTRREDPRHTYCLRYRGSITSNDKVFVHKTVDLSKLEGAEEALAAFNTLGTGESHRLELDNVRKTNLLHVVATEALDQSALIGQRLTETIFKAASFGAARRARAVTFRSPTGTNRVLEIEFDPFDPAQVAWTNESLRKFGFCAILGGFAFDLNTASVKKYCDNPKETLRYHPPVLGTRLFQEMLEEYQRPLDRPPSGIFYRPEQSYRLYVFGADNISIKETEWKLRLLEEVKLENISPILSVQVNRTYFAQRQTSLVFYGGVLKNVCIAKSSELVEMAKIPLLITKSLVALPTQIVEFRLAAAQNEAELIKAQNAVLDAQEAYLKALANPSSTVQPSKPLPTTAFNQGPPNLNGSLTFDVSGAAPDNILKQLPEGQQPSANVFACPRPKTREDTTLTSGVLN